LQESNKYATGFSVGALLLKEADSIVGLINDPTAFMLGKEKVDFSQMPLNTESSKKRLGSEVVKRLRSLEDPSFIVFFQVGTDADKRLILFYAACKTYNLIANFMLSSALDKWYSMQFDLGIDDFMNYLYSQMHSHPEIETLEGYHLKKLSQVGIKMLKEFGLLHKGRMRKLELNDSVLRLIVLNGDSWFLEVLFLNETERKSLIES
jgi:hypothetical protein